MNKCSMGAGCDEYGVCYAESQGEPDRCPLKNDEDEDCEHVFKSDLAGGYFCWKCDKTL